VVVLGFELVQGRAAGEIVLCPRRRGEGNRRCDHAACAAVMTFTHGPQSHSYFGTQPGEIGRRDQIGLVQDHEIGAGELIGENLLAGLFVIDRRIGRAPQVNPAG